MDKKTGKAKGGFVRAANLSQERRSEIAKDAALARWKGPSDNMLKDNGNIPPEIPVVWGKGPVKFYDIELDCYILDDGTAVLSKAKMMKAIGRPWKGASRTEMPTFIGAMNLQPFVARYPELEELLKGTDFYDGTRLVSGYRADILPLVCNVYLDARNARPRVLSKSQEPVALKCEMLLRSFARVGIVALIYEQLGFEKFKNPDALRLLVESYLAEEDRRWVKEFHNEFFYNLDRIYGNAPTTSRNRPKYYAGFIRKYIYNPIEKGLVLNELDKRNPSDEKGTRKKRHHTLLNEEIGIPSLRKMIERVTALLSISPNKRRFDNAYSRMMGKPYTPDMFDEER